MLLASQASFTTTSAAPSGPARKGSMMPSEADGVSREFMDREEAGKQTGMASGVTGEFMRYKYLFYKQPSEDDRIEALATAQKIRCDVCTEIVASLAAQAKSFSEDDIADMLDGDTDYALTGELVTDRMLQHKKGCNKHFKDELIAKGFTVRQCKDVAPEKGAQEPCLHREPEPPGEQARETYEIWKESLFYACEQSVAHFKDDIAASLSEALRAGKNKTEASVCKSEARCSHGMRKSVQKPAGSTRKKRRKGASESRPPQEL